MNTTADETRARDAATAVAAWGDRFNSLEGKVNLLQWMAGFNLALTTAILWRVFS